jgi:glycosyltransferase involved in cell wall biosynthesis
MPQEVKLRIALECRIDDPRQGAGASTLSLAHFLSAGGGEGQEYTFLVHEDSKDWLAPHVFGPCKLVGIPRRRSEGLRKALRSVAPLREAWRKFSRSGDRIPASDGYVEAEGFDLVHFPTQSAYLTRIPSIYQPWDLQHLHYPEFFSRFEYLVRERRYRAFCRQARRVCVQTEWSKRDLVDSYGIDQEKIAVIPWGSVLDAHTPPSPESIRAAVEKFQLPAQFFFYPAVTWPHKNHAVVLRALQRLRAEEGRTVFAYFSGAPTPHRRELESLARQLGVSAQIRFLGYLPAPELRALFATATALVFPSKFEGFGLPILEAFQAGLPVLCSHATVLPEVAGAGALFFDPDSPAELAERMKAVLDDPELRRKLASRGRETLSRSSMQETAAAFRNLYRQVVLEARAEATAEKASTAR